MKRNQYISFATLVIILLLGTSISSCSDNSDGDKETTALPQPKLTETVSQDDVVALPVDEESNEEDCIAVAESAEYYKKTFERCLERINERYSNDVPDKDFGGDLKYDDEKCLELAKDNYDFEAAYVQCVEDKARQDDEEE